MKSVIKVETKDGVIYTTNYACTQEEAKAYYDSLPKEKQQSTKMNPLKAKSNETNKSKNNIQQ
jgi:hypothetical protein